MGSDASPLIHLVDDDESLRTALLRLLQASGMAARGYATASEFLRRATPDLRGCLLLDVNLPDYSGLDLLVALPRIDVLLPVVILTGHPNEAARTWAMRAGAIDYLLKPADGASLLAALGRALALAAARRGPGD
jgi:FixJ family two-component response regulator